MFREGASKVTFAIEMHAMLLYIVLFSYYRLISGVDAQADSDCDKYLNWIIQWLLINVINFAHNASHSIYHVPPESERYAIVCMCIYFWDWKITVSVQQWCFQSRVLYVLWSWCCISKVSHEREFDKFWMMFSTFGSANMAKELSDHGIQKRWLIWWIEYLVQHFFWFQCRA